VSVQFPTSTAHAIDLLTAPGDPLIPVAGGTDLLVHWPRRLEEHDRRYLDLSPLVELKPHHWTDASLIIGAMTTYWDIVTDRRAQDEFPLLVEAARTVGAVQIQTRGTWSGNIVNASPAADGVLALMAYDAVVVMQSAAGLEEVPLDRFYLGYKTMRRTPHQLVTAIRIPRRSYGVQVFEKVGTRRAQAISKVGIGMTRSDLGWRVVANSMAPTVRRCERLERMLDQQIVVTEPADFLPAIREDLSPIDDIRSTAAFREEVMARVLYHALRPRADFVR